MSEVPSSGFLDAFTGRRIAELERSSEELRSAAASWRTRALAAERLSDTHLIEVISYRAALRFYADARTYQEQMPDPGKLDGVVPINDDAGERARHALTEEDS